MIYVDNAATTQLSERALSAMLPFLRDNYGNASALYSLARQAKIALENARVQVAKAISAKPCEIIFTSGGSEANNQVLQGLANLFAKQKIHVITSSIEHPSILATCKALEQRGITFTYLAVDQYGQINLEALQNAIRSETRLISIMLANNEIGTIQPLARIAKIIKGSKILLHTDAVQAVGHLPINVQELGIDFLSASGHKFHGPKGVGFLYKRENLDLPALIYGGGQENNLRSGTENIAAIVGLGEALSEVLETLEEDIHYLTKLKLSLYQKLDHALPQIKINGYLSEKSLATILNLSLPNVSGESLVHLLDLKGICLSTASACASGKAKISHVLKAMGLSEKEAQNAIRFSFSRFNTEKEVQIIAETIIKTVRLFE